MDTTKNLGVLIGRKDTDFIAGGSSSLPYAVVNPSGDWTPYEPLPENQNSNYTDSMACVSYSATHCIETQLKFFGKPLELSERFIAKLSNTTSQGNYQNVVADTIKKYGMVLETDWPAPPDFTWDSFYAPIPQNIIDKGQEFLKQWNVGYEFVNASDVAKNILQAPLQMVITAENPFHAVELVNSNTYFDSYSPYNKPLGTVHDYFKILVNPIIPPVVLPPALFHMDMNYGQTSNDIATLNRVLNSGQTPNNYYGDLTQKYVWKFQLDNRVASFWEILFVKGRRVGPKTRIALNLKFKL